MTWPAVHVVAARARADRRAPGASGSGEDGRVVAGQLVHAGPGRVADVLGTQPRRLVGIPGRDGLGQRLHLGRASRVSDRARSSETRACSDDSIVARIVLSAPSTSTS